LAVPYLVVASAFPAPAGEDPDEDDFSPITRAPRNFFLSAARTPSAAALVL
jgi:hypothetical protein